MERMGPKDIQKYAEETFSHLSLKLWTKEAGLILTALVL
jgi:hypothetical protein